MVYSRRSTKSKITRDRYSRKLQAFVMTLREEEKTAISSGQGQIVDDSQMAIADPQDGEVRICRWAVRRRLAGRAEDRSINGHFRPFLSSKYQVTALSCNATDVELSMGQSRTTLSVS